MKTATFCKDGKPVLGIVLGDRIYDAAQAAQAVFRETSLLFAVFWSVRTGLSS